MRTHQRHLIQRRICDWRPLQGAENWRYMLSLSSCGILSPWKTIHQSTAGVRLMCHDGKGFTKQKQNKKRQAHTMDNSTVSYAFHGLRV